MVIFLIGKFLFHSTNLVTIITITILIMTMFRFPLRSRLYTVPVTLYRGSPFFSLRVNKERMFHEAFLDPLCFVLEPRTRWNSNTLTENHPCFNVHPSMATLTVD